MDSTVVFMYNQKCFIHLHEGRDDQYFKLKVTWLFIITALSVGLPWKRHFKISLGNSCLNKGKKKWFIHIQGTTRHENNFSVLMVSCSVQFKDLSPSAVHFTLPQCIVVYTDQSSDHHCLLFFKRHCWDVESNIFFSVIIWTQQQNSMTAIKQIL